MMNPATPAASVTKIGETPKSQINKAAPTGIQRFRHVIPAVRAMVKTGAAIKATTAGRIPLNTFSTIG